MPEKTSAVNILTIILKPKRGDENPSVNDTQKVCQMRTKLRNFEIRGVSKESGKFVYGLPKIIKNAAGEVVAVYICYFTKSFKLVEDEILPGTLGEYIGQNDKNKAEIYEGDIVFHSEFPEYTYEYRFVDCGFIAVEFVEGVETTCYYDISVEDLSKYCIVIGNIHEPLQKGNNDNK